MKPKESVIIIFDLAFDDLFASRVSFSRAVVNTMMTGDAGKNLFADEDNKLPVAVLDPITVALHLHTSKPWIAGGLTSTCAVQYERGGGDSRCQFPGARLEKTR